MSEHRFVWETNHGVIPIGMEIDHINGDRQDNRIENLRLVTRQQNNFNREVKPMTNIKVVGGRYQVRITKDAKQHCLGTYDTLEEAQTVRKKGRLKLYEGYNLRG